MSGGLKNTVAVPDDNAGIAVPECESEQIKVFQYLNGYVSAKSRGISKRRCCKMITQFRRFMSQNAQA